MPIISGSMLFNVTNSSPTTGTAVANIPIVLRHTTTGQGLVVLTNASGQFTFNNVPNGTYTLVEAWGTTGGVTTPGNFATATVIAAPTPKDPPITAMPSPPATANQVQSLSPNTQNLTVTADLTGRNFVDGPVDENPLAKLDTTIIGTNLITVADGGIWGTLPAGTAVNQSPAVAPYAGVVPGFPYQQATASTPNDGNYSVININNFFTFGYWYCMADHTTRDETGRFQLVNGGNPGGVLFTQTVPVVPNKNYMLSLWISNILTVGALPQVGVRLKNGAGATIFNQVLSSITTYPIPNWNEQGTLLSVGNNTSVTLEIYSNGAGGGGNDYAIDDIFIQEVQVATIVNARKVVDRDYATIGDTLTYTVVLRHTGQSTVTNMTFYDTIPAGTSFIAGTVRIDGTTLPALNPSNITFTSPQVPFTTGKTITVTFNTRVTTIPNPNPVPNTGYATYSFVPVAGGSTITQNIATNSVSTTVNYGEIIATKIRDKAYVSLGDTITYTIPLYNNGNTTVNQVRFTDTIPNGTTLVPDSLTIDDVPQLGASPAPPTGITINTISANTRVTLAFKVRVTTTPVPNPISNSGTIGYSYTVDPSVNRTVTTTIHTNSVLSQYNLATLTSTKVVDKVYANIGDTLTYTIVLRNTGNVTANNILFKDGVPQGTSFITGTFTQDTTPIATPPSSTGVTLPNTIGSGRTTTITFKVRVVTLPNPNPIPNSATSTYTYTVDPSTPNSYTGQTATTTVTTQVNNANLGLASKSVDKAYAACGSTLTYTINIPNTGSTTALNVILKDTIPTGTTLVPDSVYVNGAQQLGVNPATGINIGSIAPGATTVVTFTVTVQC